MQGRRTRPSDVGFVEVRDLAGGGRELDQRDHVDAAHVADAARMLDRDEVRFEDDLVAANASAGA